MLLPGAIFRMSITPIIERELRVALRKQNPARSRFKVAAVGVGIAIALLLLSVALGVDPWNGIIHQYVFAALVYLTVTPALVRTAGLFAEERRNQTLELIFLTGMKPIELFIGKLVGGILMTTVDLLAVIPLLALPFLAGGVSLELYLSTITCLPSLMLLTVAVASFASILSREDAGAMLWSVLILAVLSISTPLPYALGKIVTGAAPFSSSWLCWSPAYGAYLVMFDYTASGGGGFWITTVGTLAWACGFLILAAWNHGRVWKRDVLRSQSESKERFWPRVVHGSTQWRTMLRRHIVFDNPFRYLAQRDRIATARLWFTLTLVVSFWFVGWWAWPGQWLCPANLIITAFILIVLAGILETFAAASVIGEIRRDGTLELLLTTTLSPERILAGQMAAVEAQFRPVRMLLIAMVIVCAVWGWFLRSWTTGAMVSYSMLWVALLIMAGVREENSICRPMWLALNTGRSAQAILGVPGSRWTMLYVAIQVPNIINALKGGLGGFPSGADGELVLVGILLLFVFAGMVAQQYGNEEFKHLFIQGLRLIAQEPLPNMSDPRIKNWDGKQRLSSVIGQGIEPSTPSR